MNLPPSLTEDEFLTVLDYIAGLLAAKHKFGNHDLEDVRQMVAVYALEVLPRYDPSKGNLEGFLYRHCSNRLLNARRDLGFRTDAPCPTCYKRALGTGKGHPDGSTCPKFASWWARRRTRASLATPCSVERVAELEQESRMLTDSRVEADAENEELLALIDAHIPLDLRADYLRMRGGCEKVPKVRRERVLRAARDILDDSGQYDRQRLSGTDAFDGHDDELDDSDGDE